MIANKMAVIGDKDVVLAFRALGMDVFHEAEHDDIKARIKELEVDGYAIIFVTETVAKTVSQFLETFNQKPYPVIMSIPDTGSTDSNFSVQKIIRNMERAVGSSAVLRN